MCGICGFLSSNLIPGDRMQAMIYEMQTQLIHRGPDDSGIWVDEKRGIALGHRRLSIIDLSAEGHQPMASPGQRYVIVYNGEIYNFRELRDQLEYYGFRFRGHSDTEIMLAAFQKWGIEKAVKRFIGMFVFALWDQHEQILYLGRDRLGEKPLYYGWQGNTLLFASELKAMRSHPDFQNQVDRDAVSLFMRFGYIPSPHSIYKGIKKLMPGSLISIKPQDIGKYPHPQAYWALNQVVERGRSNPLNGNSEEAVSCLDSLLRQAIRGQMVADVPIGAFLSGGIDSSTVVALMQAESNRPVRTFSIGFREEEYNEAQYAKEVAAYLGTDHTELYVTPAEAREVIPRLPELYDEPFADSSQIPTHILSRLTRQHVTVSLSGDGGDELFGGYNRYFWGSNIWTKIGWMPYVIRRIGAKSMTALSPAAWDRLFSILNPIIPNRLRQQLPGDKVHKLAKVMAVTDAQSMYRGLVSSCKEPEQVVLYSREPEIFNFYSEQYTGFNDLTHWMMYMDTLTYLPDDILVKVDRAAMGVSLESRIPFLDHRVVEFAWTLPLDMKVKSGEGKWILRQVLYRYVPKEIIERPKMGFGVPIDSWLRGPLKEWAGDLLQNSRLVSEGYLNPEPIKKKWHEHLQGKRNWQYYLWNVIMFQAWLENQH